MEVVNTTHPCILGRRTRAADSRMPRESSEIELHFLPIVAGVVEHVHRADLMLVPHGRKIGKSTPAATIGAAVKKPLTNWHRHP